MFVVNLVANVILGYKLCEVSISKKSLKADFVFIFNRFML